MIVKIVLIALTACDPQLTRLFTPLHPQLGSYEVCTDPRPIEDVAGDTRIEEVEPLEALGGAGSYDRAAVARLYGGRRAKVARGWRSDDGRFESITRVSPYPDATLTHLEPGTMIVRWTLTP